MDNIYVINESEKKSIFSVRVLWNIRKFLGSELFCDLIIGNEIMNCEKYSNQLFYCRTCTNGNMPISTQRRGEY